MPIRNADCRRLPWSWRGPREPKRHAGAGRIVVAGITPERLIDRGERRSDTLQSGPRSRPGRRGKGTTVCYRWLNDAPLRKDERYIQVNWFSIETCGADGAVTLRAGFTSNLPVQRDTVAAMVAAGSWSSARESVRHC